MTTPPCVTDPASVEGLKRLARERPDDWSRALRDGVVPFDGDLEEATLAEVVRSGLVRQVLPKGPRDLARLLRARASARRAIAALGEVRIADLDEEALVELRQRLIAGEEGDGLSPEVATRTVSMVRKAAAAWARATGLPSPVARRAPAPSAPAPRRSARPVPSLREVQRLLHVAFPAERPVLALALGGGLGEQEIRSLRGGDLLVRRGRRRVRWLDGRTGSVATLSVHVVVPAAAGLDPYGLGSVRVAPLPTWVIEILAASPDRPLDREEGVYLFPHRSDPDRPRSGFRSMMQRLNTQAFGPKGARWSVADLQRAWQVVAREAGLARAVVRGSWSMEPPQGGRLPRSAELETLERLANAWPTLGAEAARSLVPGVRLPRRAPKGCGAGESEMTDPWAGWKPLPQSCGV